MHSYSRDIGAILSARFGAFESAEADGTAKNGAGFDKLNFDLQSVKALVSFSAPLEEGETLNITATVETSPVSDFSSDVTTLKTFATENVVATGGAGGSTETGVAEFDADITGANQFVRVTYTPTRSAPGADEAVTSLVYVVSGAKVDPITSSPEEVV